jgi:hypothetical protein
MKKGSKHKPESLELLRKFARENPDIRRRPRSDEFKARMSVLRMGVRHTEETKRKISESRKRLFIERKLNQPKD